MGGRRGGWERGEAAVTLETTGGVSRQPSLLGAVDSLLKLRGVAEQQPAPASPESGRTAPEKSYEYVSTYRVNDPALCSGRHGTLSVSLLLHPCPPTTAMATEPKMLCRWGWLGRGCQPPAIAPPPTLPPPLLWLQPAPAGAAPSRRSPLALEVASVTEGTRRGQQGHKVGATRWHRAAAGWWLAPTSRYGARAASLRTPSALLLSKQFGRK
eukprot:COSAG04_NODE_2630_length_3833_cov_1.806642_3_plen_212_part_00